MPLLVSFVVAVVWIVLKGIGFLVLLGVLIAIGVALRKPVAIALNPRCISCKSRSLQRYKLPFSDAKEFRYYRCLCCCAHLKRSKGGVWITLPRGTARDVDRGKLFAKPANLIQCAEDSLSHDPMGSWFGKVNYALPGESWPEYDGIPMLPLCQLRCSEILNLPFALKNVALVTVFTAFVGEEAISPCGERWVLRTYATLDDLFPITYPGNPTDLRPYPIAWNPVNDYPTYYSDIPESLWIDWENLSGVLHPSYQTSKVGGYGWDVHRTPPKSDRGLVDLCFQFVVRGDYPWQRGPGGTLCFAHSSSENADSWWIDCQQSHDSVARHVMPVRLGCEVEGLEIAVHRPPDRHSPQGLAMSYHGNSGILYRLDDLRGLVQITESETALLFVRLRTCGLHCEPATYEYEVFTQADYAAQPAWAQSLSRTRPIGCKVRRDGDRSKFILARIALDAAMYQKCGFEPPQVEPIEGGFRIERWVCKLDFKKESEDVYRKLAETVLTDGTYTRTVITQLTVAESGVYDSF